MNIIHESYEHFLQQMTNDRCIQLWEIIFKIEESEISKITQDRRRRTVLKFQNFLEDISLHVHVHSLKGF